MIKWIKKNRLEVCILLLIILIASFLRFYRLGEYMTFLGDEGRDALVVKGILVDHHFPFIGPPMSVGNVYLGPLYYYMMALPMAIFWLNPEAAVGMVVLIGVATVGLIYFLARRWFGVGAAMLSSLLYALSFVTITYSRSSWNPNPAPFFALLAILGLDQAYRSRNFRWFILSGASIAAALQMHYLALILLPIFSIFWASQLQKSHKYSQFILGTVGAIVAFILVMLPLILFDFKHDFMNSRAMITLFTGNGAVGFNPLTSLSSVIPIYVQKLIGRYLAGENSALSWLISALSLIPFILLWRMKTIKDNLRWPYWILGVWLGLGMFFLAFYRQEIFDHYLGFVSPVPFLLLGGLISYFGTRWKIITALLIVAVLGILNLQKNPLWVTPNNQLAKTQDVAKFVIQQSGNQPFNFALIAKNNYDAAYQFYLEQYGHNPKMLPFEKTSQLFVVCEDQVCNPINHPKYEIAAFGWAKIENIQDFAGVKVFKLVPNPSGK